MNFFKKQNNLSNFIFFKLKTTLSIFAVVVFILLAAPAVVLAQAGLEYGTFSGLGTQDIRVTVMEVIRIFLGLVGIIATLIILYAGYVWMTSAGNPERIDYAKRTLRNAAIGLLIIFSAFSIVSFIIGQLRGATGIPGAPGVPPGGPCTNCGQLGSGVLERVYPEPFAREVARNTSMMATFKVDMDPGTIIDRCTAATLPCSGDLAGNITSPNVLIYRDSLGVADAIPADEVIASSSDGKTFIFRTLDLLGNPDSNTWYAVELTDAIEKKDGSPAFPGINGGFVWRFEIGTFIDIDPPYVENIFPEPDDDGDIYQATAGDLAQWDIFITEVPQVLVDAQYTEPVDPNITVDGTYNGSYDGDIQITINGGANTGTANVQWIDNVLSPNNNPVAPIAGGSIGLGGGLTLNSTASYVSGSQWTISVIAARTPSTLRVDSTFYTFVSASTGGDEIVLIPGDTATTAAVKIAAAIDTLTGISASSSGGNIEVVADTPGSAANSLILIDSGWADISQTVIGTNAGFNLVANGSPADKAKNAVFIIDFNETMMPDELTSANVEVSYVDANGVTQTPVANYLISNQYKTLELISDEVCLDASGAPLQNSCGDQIFCWPVNSAKCSVSLLDCTVDADCGGGETCTVFEPTEYRITIHPGYLEACTTNIDCSDPNFSTCLPIGNGTSACSNGDLSDPVFYSSAKIPPDGVIDATSPGNSFNADKTDTYTLASGQVHGRSDGPRQQTNRPYFNRNDGSGDGDDLTWSFYLNNSIDLTPPALHSVGPDVLTNSASLISPIEGKFDEIMFSSTLKSGSNYRDGLCGCDSSNNNPNGTNPDCQANETCDARNVCVNDDVSAQVYCADDNECGNAFACVNKKYVTLIDQSTSPSAWWIEKNNVDENPEDGFMDRTIGFIEHTRFIESTNYGAEFGAGIKDAYQNCYLPSSSLTPSCDGSPYCCNGFPLNEADWLLSACNTGF